MLTQHQRAEKAQQMRTAALATETLNALPPDVVISTFEAHIVGRSDINPSAIEAMSDRVRRLAWARERGEI
ncbi:MULTISPECIES: hypothetical protein [Marivita]|uniref:Uncharacterized protein n=1 Tax=Marivita cryptomonadis TaxID=505252 RepID=A0A9Q2NX25_9RHOB|nr:MULTISPECIES: hypothetical protein [Marivita]MCR9167938.1 hypothetical protein [Paracoccaceae bacterium]MBM2322689.1 hypothetical protein [Marivita cryptomonadis]MBM2332271.1 hypothetical protein [Marivita cryptomonadis]MBM2341855.1 hypothetical protein [Marivita cryptomonadis]MBM2346519.1 hypothetical protein [Marivita cryptomonadis]